MDYSIVPSVGGVPLQPEDIKVIVPEGFDEFVEGLVLEVQQYTQITSDADLALIVGAQGRLIFILNKIEKARAEAVVPINATHNAIQDAAAMASEPLKREKKRLDNLLRARADAEEEKRKSIIREAYQEQEKIISAQKARISELEEAQQKLRFQARESEDLIEAGKLRTEADQLNEEAFETRYQLSLAEDTTVIEPEFPEKLLKGASTPENIDPEIVDEELLIRALSADILSQKPTGLIKCVKIELKKSVMKEFIKDRRKAKKNDPNYSVEEEFLNAGVKVVIYRKPVIRQSAAIVRHE